MRNPYLCLAIAAMLGVVGLVGLGGTVFLAYCQRPIPESLVAVTSGAVGSLSSFLVMPPRGSAGVADPPDRECRCPVALRGTTWLRSG